MVFIVVEWKNENSVSVVDEKQVVDAVELKEGTTVALSAGTNKGKAIIDGASILKICATKKQALEYEKSLLTPAAVETKEDEKRKRPRKPSQKVKENFEGDVGTVQEGDEDNEEDQIPKKKRRMNKKGKDADKEDEKRRETAKKLLQSVQEERVAKILLGSCKPELLDLSDSEETAMHNAAVSVTKTTTPDNHRIAKHISTITYQSQTTPLVNHSTRTNTITSHAYSPTQTTPLLNRSSQCYFIGFSPKTGKLCSSLVD